MTARNPKDLIGAKKVALGLLPAAGVIHGADAAHYGAYRAGKDGKGYGPYNWRSGPPVYMTIYLDAIERHILALRDGEDIATDSGVHHLGHVIAGAAIVLDAISVGQLFDDRPVKGAAARLLAEMGPERHTQENCAAVVRSAWNCEHCGESPICLGKCLLTKESCAETK